MLRDLLSSCREENNQLNKKLENTMQQNAALMHDLSIIRADKSKELAEVRADIRLKSFELTSLGAKYEVRGLTTISTYLLIPVFISFHSSGKVSAFAFA